MRTAQLAVAEADLALKAGAVETLVTEQLTAARTSLGFGCPAALAPVAAAFAASSPAQLAAAFSAAVPPHVAAEFKKWLSCQPALPSAERCGIDDEDVDIAELDGYMPLEEAAAVSGSAAQSIQLLAEAFVSAGVPPRQLSPGDLAALQHGGAMVPHFGAARHRPTARPAPFDAASAVEASSAALVGAAAAAATVEAAAAEGADL